MSPVGNEQFVRIDGDAGLFKIAYFLAQPDRIHDHTVADDTGFTLPQNT